MRTWVKATIGVAVVMVVGMIAFGATAAYFVMRHMDKRVAPEAGAVQEIDTARARFGQRKPLIELVDPRHGDIRINRASEASTARVETIHVINWKSDTGEVVRTDVPVWLMRSAP